MRVPSRLEEYALVIDQILVESLDGEIDLKGTTDSDEWWEENVNKWNFFHDLGEQEPVWAMMTQTCDTPDAEIPVKLQPNSFKEAMTGPLSEHWKRAVETELSAHSAMGTWTLVKRSTMPKDAVLLGSKWVWKAKLDENGKFKLARARLVCQGHRQRNGIDFNEVFAPTVKWTTLKLGIAMSTILGWEIYQYDIDTAFLEAKLEEDLFMKPPEGLDCSPDDVCKLQRSLYGTKQANRNFYMLIVSFLIVHGYIQSAYDPRLFYGMEVPGDNESTNIRIYVFVDDFIVTAPTKEIILGFRSLLKSRFGVKDIGPTLQLRVKSGGVGWSRLESDSSQSDSLRLTQTQNFVTESDGTRHICHARL
jgi:hypothetical protein